MMSGAGAPNGSQRAPSTVTDESGRRQDWPEIDCYGDPRWAKLV
jgi:hypothetical protein